MKNVTSEFRNNGVFQYINNIQFNWKYIKNIKIEIKKYDSIIEFDNTTNDYSKISY